MDFIDKIFTVIILIMSVVVHEFAHGYAAYLLGDNTARLSGRLTLNPIKHLDPIGSVIVPLILALSPANFIIGWAKPVPYNPANLRNEKTGTFWVSIAGILTNLIVAIIFGLLIRFAPFFISVSIAPAFYKITSIIVFINLILAIFNLIPIPPLDGSKLLFSFLPLKYRYIENFLEKWGMFLLILFIVFLWDKVAPIVYIIFHGITGLFLM